MRIRPYIPSKDYEYVSKWIDDERTHAFWCANLLPYPMTQKSFHDLLEKNAMDWTDSAYYYSCKKLIFQWQTEAVN